MAFLIVLLLILLFIYLLTSRSIGIRESIIQSYLLIFGLTAILTELLSLVDLLTYQFIVSAWLLLNGVVFPVVGQKLWYKVRFEPRPGINVATTTSILADLLFGIQEEASRTVDPFAANSEGIYFRVDTTDFSMFLV